MLRGAGEPQEPQNAVSSAGDGRRKVDGAVEYPTPIDCDNASTLKAVQGGDTSSDTDGGSGVHPSSDGSRSIEQGSRRGSPDIPAASLSSPELRCVSEKPLPGDSTANR